jgi:hypothetical protein
MDTSPKGVTIMDKLDKGVADGLEVDSETNEQRCNNYKMLSDALNNGEAESLIDDLFWEWERLSSSGKETLNKLAKVFKMEGYYE